MNHDDNLTSKQQLFILLGQNNKKLTYYSAAPRHQNKIRENLGQSRTDMHLHV
jgi:hypothetical protein